MRRHLLAVLLTEPGATFSTDRLIEELWPAGAPASAARNVKTHVWELRRVLGAGQIASESTGYRLAADPSEVDSLVFADAVTRGFAELRRRDPAGALDTFEGALAHWRGTPFADAPATGLLLACRTRLEEQRRTVREEVADLLLAAGRHRELIDGLHREIEADPLRERLWGQLMTALVRAGRRAEALRVYRELRRLLADELGVEPAAEIQRLHERILRDDAEPVQAPEAPVTVSTVPRQLPPVPGRFVGHLAELSTLDRFATDTGAPAVTVISGMAGVGKTTLAVRWAHQARERFPDGQVFVDLHGYGPGRPLPPVEALAHVLTALGVPAHQVPTDEQRATGQLRSLLASRRVLLLLDNVSAAEHVRPLLAGGPGTTVLVTSRARLAGLVARDGARQLDLRELSTPEAVQLIDPGAAEHAVAEELAALCGGLPLALRIAAATIDRGSVAPVAQLVERLRCGDRLAAFAVPGDARSSVERAFAVSYHALGERERTLFRRLSLLPVADFGPALAAALLDRPAGETADAIRVLVDAFLVRSLGDGRYTLHDLIREYAAGLAGTDPGRDGALRRGYLCYLVRSEAAALALYPQMQRLPVPHPVEPAEPAEAVRWLAAEHRNLVPLIGAAARLGVPEYAWRLCSSLRGHFMGRRDLLAWRAGAEAALAAATAQGDLAGRAIAQLTVALAEQAAGEYRNAIAHCVSTEHLAERTRWSSLAASAANAGGVAHSVIGETAEALAAFDRALAIHRRSGSTTGTAIVLNNMAAVHTLCDRLDVAKGLLQEALASHRRQGIARGAASVLVGLGIVEARLDQAPAARALLAEAIETYRRLGDVEGEMIARLHLARVLLALDDPAGALRHARTAVAALRPTGDLHTHSLALSSLATVRRCGGQAGLAKLYQRGALRLAYAAGSREAIVTALLGLAELQYDTRAFDAADHYAGQALDAARDAGYQAFAAQAHRIRAEVRRSLTAIRYGFLPAAQTPSIGTGSSPGSGRQNGRNTAPGSSISRPSK